MTFQKLSRVIIWIESLIICFKLEHESDKTNRNIEGTKFYHYPKENTIIRFDSAEFLLWEKRHRNQANLHHDDLI